MTTMQQRRGTAAQWTSANPILDAGEIGFETDTNKFKFGDGTTAWNSLAPYHEGNITLLKTYVKNSTGSTIPKGSAVYISGATGANALISLADADTEATSSKTLGLTEIALTTGSSGYVITNGTLTGLDTSAWTEGTALWLSSTAGGLTSTKPTGPTHSVYIGVVTRSHAQNGEILIKVQNGYELDELHDVAITSNTAGEILKWDGTTWVNNTLAEANIAALTGASFTGTVNVTTANNGSSVVLKNDSGTGLRILAGESVSGSLPGVIISPYIDGTEKTNSQFYYGDNGDQWVFEPTLKLGNGTLTTGSTTSYIFNTIATTLNIGGAATTVNIGAATGNTQVLNNLVVSGNLTVQGDQVITNTATVEVEDTMLYIGTGNSANAKDIGFVGHFTSGTYQHTGFVRDASDGVWKIFSNVSTEPSNDTLDFTGATYDGLKIGALDATNGTFSGALTYGGVTLTNAVTGTGKMVLDTAPTISGTLTASGGITSALQKASAIAAPYYASVAESAGQFAGFASGAGANSTGSRVIMTASQTSSAAPASRPDGSTLRAGDIWISW